MIKITSTFFTDLSQSSPITPNNPALPPVNPVLLTEYFGYKPMHPKLFLEALPQFNSMKVASIRYSITARFIKFSNPGYTPGQTDSYLTGALGFGPLSTDGISYYPVTSMLPLYILEHYLLTNIQSVSLLYIELLIEYHTRYMLHEKYSRPLDPFTFPENLESNPVERFYNPLSPDAYPFIDERIWNDTQIYDYYCSSVIPGCIISTASLSLLKTILLCLNSTYIDADKNMHLNNLRISDNFIIGSKYPENYAGGITKRWIVAIIKEMSKREEQYNNILYNPENVIFSL